MIVKNIRKFSRYASEEPMLCKIKNNSALAPETFTSKAINVSKNGVLLKTDRLIDQNRELIVKIHIGREAFIFKGKSVYCMQSTEGHFECGVHIQKVNKSNRMDDYYDCIDQLVRVDGPDTKTFSVDLNDIVE